MLEHSPYPDAVSILAEFEIEVVAKNVMPMRGQTRAIGTVQQISDRHGFDHARFVIQTLAETVNNQAALDRATITATSNIVIFIKRAYPSLIERHTERFFAFYDRLPLGALEWRYACLLDGIARRSDVLLGMIAERVIREFGEPQQDLFDDRKGVA